MGKVLILDSNSILYRAFHALPPLTTKKGELVNAVYGFLLVFFKVLKEFKPDFVFACFDFPAPTFRHKEFEKYKATRPPMPKDLSSQIPKIKEILNAFSILILEKEGYEADDLISALSKRFQKEEKIIVSGDSDLFQLIDKNTKIYLLKRGLKSTILYDENLIEREYGLKPKQFLDFKALIGDPSDNLPRVPGIGKKTAISLLLKFGNLENLYKEIEENSEKAKKLRPGLKETLLKYKKQTFLSKSLIILKKDLPLEFNLEKCLFGKYNQREVLNAFKKWEFNSLVKRFLELDREVKKAGNLPEESFQRKLKLW